MWTLYKLSKNIKALFIIMAGFIVIAFYTVLSKAKNEPQQKEKPDQVLRIKDSCYDIVLVDTIIHITPDTVKYIVLPYKHFKQWYRAK